MLSHDFLDFCAVRGVAFIAAIPLVLLFFLLFAAELAAWAWWKRAAGRSEERVVEQQMGAKKSRFAVRNDRFIAGEKTLLIPLRLLVRRAVVDVRRAFHIVLHRTAEERHTHLPPLICEEGFVGADHRCLLQGRCLFTAPLGCSLAAWLEAAALDTHVPLAVPLLVGLCDAVRELHEHGVVHVFFGEPGFLHRPGEEFASFYASRAPARLQPPADAVEQLVDCPQPGDRPARPKPPVREVTVTMEGKNTATVDVEAGADGKTGGVTTENAPTLS
ncbi:hypothetical protein M3Y99_00231700 [Aphelenchoides fujianensis]|nr:hypothetical protein M3Y99_00231700 [Aphelenchoides fujianensis]